MKSMPSIKQLHTLLASLLLLLIGCDVHEFPQEEPDTPPIYSGTIPFTLHLDCHTEIPLHQEITYITRSAEAETEHDVRYIVNIYRSENARDFSREADTTIVFTQSLTEERSHSLQLELEQGLYNFIVWSDHVDKGSDRDKYYDTTDFAEIIYSDRKNYEGNNDYKDSFRGTRQVKVEYTATASGDAERQEVTIPLERPFAKYKLIATDLEEFVRRITEKQFASGATSLHIVNPEEYRVIFRYTGYMPCSYNMFTNKPADAWTGISFESQLKPLDEQEVELGFDYVFVNGTETKISVAVEVYDKNGKQVSRSNTIDIPIIRNKLTIVQGRFLTYRAATGNMGINPGYEDDYNIEIR